MDKAFPKNDNKNLILPLQGVKAIAFLGIFLSHTEYQFFSPLGSWGAFFFILSGFLMIVNYSKGNRIIKPGLGSNARFAINKIGKLYPLHIVMLLSAILLELFFRSSIKDILGRT